MPQAVMGLFGGSKQTSRNLVRNVIACIGFKRTTDSNKIELLVLDDAGYQKSRELTRIRTGLAVYLDDCTIL